MTSLNRGVIITDSTKCRECYSCVRNCPVKAVKIKDGKAQIIQERCIQCGNCLKNCSRGAKIILDGIEDTKRMLRSDQTVIAILAPSFITSFYPESVEIVIDKFRRLGFYQIWEAAIGAEYVINFVSEYINNNKNKPILSSACPAFVNLIEKHYPNLIPNLIPCCSPMAATEKLIRKHHNFNVSIVFIGPCIAKKEEVILNKDKFQIDTVLTFTELKELFRELDIDNDYKINPLFKYYTSSKVGRTIPISGGIAQNLSNNSDEVLVCDGINDCKELLEFISSKDDNSSKIKFCDTLFCKGCIDGVSIQNNSSIFFRKELLFDFIHNNKQLDYQEQFNKRFEINLTQQFASRKIKFSCPTETDISKILALTNKYEIEDQLDCGACGYNSCREKAIAVYQGIAEVEMCIPYLLFKKNELYNQLSDKFHTINRLNDELEAIFEASCDGLIVCDCDGKIIKANSAWKKMINIKGDLPRNIADLEEKKILFPSATLIALKEKRKITFLQETANNEKFIATGNPIVDKDGDIKGVVTNIRDIKELNRLRSDLYERKMPVKTFSGIIANSIEFGRVIDLCTKAAEYNSTVLILGETGVGKDVVARFIHQLSSVKDGPYIKVNCGAIPESLIESELFGYESGAFTGAKKEGKKGFFEMADGGTIFLDEIGDLPLIMQVKLLQVIQDKRINRIGSNSSKRIDVRILAATNKDLKQMVEEGKFRSDLYFRLNVIPINVPSLRERKDDIIPLAYHFLNLFNKQYKCNKEFSPEIPSLLVQYTWPGNVRELKNVIERIVVVSKNNIISQNDMPPFLLPDNSNSESKIVVNDIIPLKDAVSEVEKQILLQAYKTYRNTYEIAKILGVNQSTVVRKLNKIRDEA